jgi:Tol biopolymer transport system component
VSVSSSGTRAFSGSNESAINGDGRFVAFTSFASNLVAGDTNGTGDVFLRDRLLGTTERVSVSSTGAEANIFCGDAAISSDGRFIAFDSQATNLVPDDNNLLGDAFVHDRVTGATERISVNAAGEEGNDNSGGPKLNADGRLVAFSSQASNLVPGDNNGQSDTFVHDRSTGANELVSVPSGGGQSNSSSGPVGISADGRYVAFVSFASNLVPGDTNGATDLFLRDRHTGTTERVDLSPSGGQLAGGVFNATLSANGRVVAFDAPAGASVDAFVRDLNRGLTEQVSVGPGGEPGNGLTFFPALSADGRFVAFGSQASNLVASDANGAEDIFVRDRLAGTNELASADSAGVQGNGASFVPSLSADGRVVSFTSQASNLVAGDGNRSADVFVHDRGASPQEQLRALIRQVAGANLSHGIKRSLLAKLFVAVRHPCPALGAFIWEVRALTGKKIEPQLARELTAAAREIRTALGCR